MLEELAAIPHMPKALGPTTQKGKDYFPGRGLELAKSHGYTTATEGRRFGPMHADLPSAANRGLVDMDVTGWMDYTRRADATRSQDPRLDYHCGRTPTFRRIRGQAELRATEEAAGASRKEEA